MSSINSTKSDKVFDSVNVIVMAILLIIIVYPLYFILIASVSDPTFVNAGKVLIFPKGFTLDGYVRIIQDQKIWRGYSNTILYTTLGTSINITLTLTSAYALSRKEFRGRKFFMLLIVFTMFFNGGMIPTYMLVKKLGILNTIWAMVLPNAVSVWNLIIARTYYMTSIPDELFEAASMDGCGVLRFFFMIVMPVSKALVAVMVLFYAVGHWNAFFNALIYLENEKLYPLQLILRGILIVNQSADVGMMGDVEEMVRRQKLAELLKYGIIVVSSLPVLCLYPFVQKYFVKGVMVGSVKG